MIKLTNQQINRASELFGLLSDCFPELLEDKFGLSLDPEAFAQCARKLLITFGGTTTRGLDIRWCLDIGVDQEVPNDALEEWSRPIEFQREWEVVIYPQLHQAFVLKREDEVSSNLATRDEWETVVKDFTRRTFQEA